MTCRGFNQAWVKPIMQGRGIYLLPKRVAEPLSRNCGCPASFPFNRKNGLDQRYSMYAQNVEVFESRLDI